jgi:hypothetical protein
MRHLLNGIEITPRNRENIGVVSDFTGNPDYLNLNVDSVVIPREGYDIIKQHVQTVGLFEGIPYTVEMEPNVTLEYYIDLTDPNTKFKTYECEVKLKKRVSQESFFDDANGTSFELMLKKGVVFNTVNVPYVIIKDNQVELGVSLAISSYVMIKELIIAADKLALAVTNLIEAVTPNVGITGPSVSVGEIISLSLQVLMAAVYFAATLIAVIDLARKMFALIFPKVRYLRGSKIQELMQKGCEYLGYQFESSLLTQFPNYTVVPVPLVRGRKSIFMFTSDELTAAFNKGVPSSSDTVATLGQLFDACETAFNARTRVNNGVVRFERRDYGQTNVNVTIDPALNIQQDRDEAFSYNVDDIWKRYYIHFTLDAMDIYTMDENYDFHDAEYSTEPTSFVNEDLVSIKGLNDVPVPFALGYRKAGLNWLEKIAKGFFTVIDWVTGVLGGYTNYTGKINNRIGVLVISQNYFGVTKLLWTVGGKQPVSWANYCSGRGLWSNFHYINQITLNDYVVKADSRIRITSTDFVNLLNNNYIEVDGLVCEVLRLEWIDEKSIATITYRVPNDYASGKVFTLTINE